MSGISRVHCLDSEQCHTLYNGVPVYALQQTKYNLCMCISCKLTPLQNCVHQVSRYWRILVYMQQYSVWYSVVLGLCVVIITMTVSHEAAHAGFIFGLKINNS